MLDSALAVAKRRKSLADQAEILSFKGQLAAMHGDADQLLTFMSASHVARKQLGDSSLLVKSRNNLAIAYEYNGRMEEAAALHKENIA